MDSTPGESSATQARRIALRPARPEDKEFLRAVYASTRAAEMALIPWSEEQKAAFIEMQYNAQQLDYGHRFPAADYSVVLFDGQPVGRLHVARSDEKIHILDITILPERRNAGIGSVVLGDLLAEAQATARPLSIYVESYNPSLRLFERLGFAKVAEHGAHHLLEWRAVARDAS